MTGRHILLRGVVGSSAYGLAREGSDIDRLGIFAYPTDAFWGLRNLDDSVVTHEPSDVTLHEVAKYVRLALKCNPTILELMWLPEHLIEINTVHGKTLRHMREAFLSTKAVRDSYGGYAKQQVERLQRRNKDGKEGFSSDTKKRTAKHARHCFRLLEQGRQLLVTGNMNIRVADPASYWSFDNATVEQIVARFEEGDEEFRSAPSCLPDEPDFASVELFLHSVRRYYL